MTLLAALAAAKEETATLAMAAKAANLAAGQVAVNAEDQATDLGENEEGNAQMALTAAEEHVLLTNKPEDEYK
jgi:hypothetical protein